MRYTDPTLKEQNIEATGGGGYVSNKQYIKDFQITEKGIKSGNYLRTMTNRELLADLLADAAIYWGMNGDVKRAIRYLERSYKINSKSAEINESLGEAYLAYSKNVVGDESEEYKTKGLFHKERAVDLGLVRLPKEDYIKQLKTKAAEKAAMNKGGGE